MMFHWFPFRFRNRPLAAARRHRAILDERTPGLLSRLPLLVQTLSEGRDYLHRRVLYDYVLEYDLRCGTRVAPAVVGEKREPLLRELTGFMLTAFHDELLVIYPDSPLPMLLTDALYFEMYQCLPPISSDYVRYQNPDLEDPRTAPAFKWGQSVAGILGTLDIPFSLMMSQQCPLILNVSRKLIRFALFDEPIEAPSMGTPSTEPA
jgi:hypothetical protein